MIKVSKYNLTLIKKDMVFDITSLSGNLMWRSNIETLGAELSFDIAVSSDTYFPKLNVELGDKVIFKSDKKEIFRGIITDESINGQFSKSYVAFDFAFYLNKSKTIIQFNGMRADDAIKKLCSKVNIPLGHVPSMKTKVSGIYKDNTISEIIFEIIEACSSELGTRYFIEMIASKLHIGQVKKEAINLDLSHIGNLNITRSINELKNSIIYTSGDEKSTRVMFKVDDPYSISRFGLLQDIESVDDKDISQVRNLSKNALKEKNRVAETLSLDMIANDDIKAGLTIFLEDKSKGIRGNYLIKECTNTLSSGIRRLSLSVEVMD